MYFFKIFLKIIFIILLNMFYKKNILKNNLYLTSKQVFIFCYKVLTSFKWACLHASLAL